MIKNYIKIAWRNLWKDKTYTAVNILGLSIGLTVFLLILLYVNREHNYDQWDPELRRVYRLGVSERNEDGLEKSPSVQYPLGTYLQEECPEVELMSRVSIPYEENIIAISEQEFFEKQVISADSNFFAVFPYPFIHGDARTALNRPNTAVITKAMSEKLFGKGNPLGKTLTVNTQTIYTITGVIEKPGPSHLDFSVCLSYHSLHFASNWFMRNHDTYVRLNAHASVANLREKASSIYAKHYAASRTDGSAGSKVEIEGDPVRWLAENRGIADLGVFFEPVQAIHLQPEGFEEWSSQVPVYDFDKGNRMPVMVFSLIGFLVLLLACINYTNMAIARAGRRAKESGMRKVMGASRRQLIIQFLMEAFILCLLALLLSLYLTVALKDLLNTTFLLDLQLWNDINQGQNQLLLWQLASIVLAVTLVSGGYPAFVLSAYRPVKVLKGNISRTVKGKWLRNSLVVAQYSIASCFIISVLVIFLQLRFMQDNDPGFDGAQVLRIQRTNTLLFPGQPNDRSTEIKNRLLQIPGVQQVSSGNFYPGMASGTIQTASYDGGNTLPIQFSLINFGFFDVLGMDIVKGRDFSEQYARDTVDAAIINEAAARKMGWENPLDKTVDLMGMKYRIIGLLKDTHLSGYDTEITPQIYMMGVDEPRNFIGHSNLFVKIDGKQAKDAAQSVAALWKTIEPEFPVRYSWVDQDFAKLMEKYERFGKLTGYLTLAALGIALMGILALSAFTAQQRTKEIGIRKVLGASASGIVTLLSKDFVKLVLIAILIASPIAWWAMHKWLADFAYHIDIQWWMFAAAGLAAAVIALATVSWQAIRAAIANPVDSLRDE
ncbi:ABC transporter permease [Olivibacter sitiensis]|uniref:ABC transporter permease n=1 Tax=Olivibacter sitiensis TaxID=376470 RepID=UPI0003F7B1DC|nr:ABC transporter permease [Olivibacter sitiensis]